MADTRTKPVRVWVAMTANVPHTIAISLDELRDKLDRNGFICDSCGQPQGVEITQGTLTMPTRKRKEPTNG